MRSENEEAGQSEVERDKIGKTGGSGGRRELRCNRKDLPG